MGSTLAEKSFRQRVKEASTPFKTEHYWPGEEPVNIDAEMNVVPGSRVIISHWSPACDREAYRKAFEQYGTYLELIGGDKPAEKPFSYTFTPVKFVLPPVKDPENS